MSNGKNRGLLWSLEYYSVVPFLIWAILNTILRKPITNLFCNIQQIDPIHDTLDYGLTVITVPVVMWGLWIIAVFISTRDKRYALKTGGRSYSSDHGKYKRTYWELVDYFRDAEPHRLDTEDYPIMDWRDCRGIPLGRDNKHRLVYVPSDTETNIAVYGPPGSGKTSGLAIPSVVNYRGSCLVVDIKGDIYNYVRKHNPKRAKRILRFAPDHPDALNISCHFDPFSGIDKMDPTAKKLFIESMATVLIPDEKGSNDNFFTSRGRKLFRGVCHLILAEDPEASLPDVIHAILQGSVFDWVKKAIAIENEDNDPDIITAKELMSSFYGTNEKNTSGCWDACCSAIATFSNPVLDVLLSRSDDSISNVTLDKGYDIYLQIQQEHLDAYAPLFTLVIQTLSAGFTRRPDSSTGAKNRPILMLLDEFPQLTFDYKLINSNLSTLRSKSVIIMLIMQNLSQLEYRYQQVGARSITGNCNIQVILGSNDPASSKSFSDMFGQKKVLRAGRSQSTTGTSSFDTFGRSSQEALDKVYPPEYFGDLSSRGKEIIYFKGRYAELNKINCYKD